MAPTSKTRKAVKKATAKKTAKKNAVRTVKHGNVTYSSRPQENPGCSPRCTPPYRYVSQATGLKTTTVKYRHRNLAITSPDTVPKKRAATKKTASKTASKTAKAPSKTVKTVKKAPAKTAVKKTAVKAVKAPAVKKAPAKKTVSKTVSCGCAVTPAKTPSKPKTVTCGCAQTPAQVKKAILNKAEKEGMNRKELDKHIIVATIPKIEAKEPIKAPASWKVPTVGGRFEGKAVNTNVGATLDKNTLFKMRTRAMSANLEDWEREVLSRPYINVYYNPSRDKYLINGSRTKDSADDLTPAEAVQKLKTIGSVKPVIMNPHDPFRGRHANKSDIIAVLMTRPDYAPAMNRAVKKNAKAIKIPASWKVPTVGGKFEGKAEPIKAPASWKVPTVGGRFEGKAPAKSTAKTPAKKTATKKTSSTPSGRFDGQALKYIAQFIDKMEPYQNKMDRYIPINRASVTYVNKDHVMIIHVASKVPGRSLFGLPVGGSEKCVRAKSVINLMDSSVQDSGIMDGKLYLREKQPGTAVMWKSTQIFEDDYLVKDVKVPPLEFNTYDTYTYTVTAAQFVRMLKSIQLSGRGYGPVHICPNGGVGRPDDDDSDRYKECGTYSEHYLYRIAQFITHAKNGRCTVTYRLNYPMKVECDYGMYHVTILLAPVVVNG